MGALAYGLFMATLRAWCTVTEPAPSSSRRASSAKVATRLGGRRVSEPGEELGLIFACGAWSVQACRMVTGLVRDRYGTRVASSA